MSRRIITMVMVFAAAMMISAPSWAKASSKNNMKATITLDSTTKVANKNLSAGKYNVLAEGTMAKFERNGKVVAEVPCVMKTLTSKAKQDEFEVDHGRLTQIRVSGKMQAIQFKS